MLPLIPDGPSRVALQIKLGAPESIRRAGPAAVEDLPSGLFADPESRSFPIDRRASTWDSFALYLDKRAELGPVLANRIGRRLREAAIELGLASEFERMEKAAAAADAPPAPPEGPRPAEGEPSIRNAREVGAASDWLRRNSFNLARDRRRAVARRVLDKAAELDVEVGPEVYRAAGMGSCCASDIAAMLRDRGVRVAGAEPETANLLFKQAAALCKDAHRPAYAPEVEGYVELVEDMVDIPCKLDRLYGTMSHPDDLYVLNQAEVVKAASDLLPLVDRIYQVQDLHQLRWSGRELRERIGARADEVVSGHYVDFIKMADVAPDWPARDQIELRRWISDAKIASANLLYD